MLLALPPMTSLEINPSHEVDKTMLISENEVYSNKDRSSNQITQNIKKIVSGMDLDPTPQSSVEDVPDSCKKDDVLPPTSSPLLNGHHSDNNVIIDYGDSKEESASIIDLDADTESSSCFSSSSDSSDSEDNISEIHWDLNRSRLAWRWNWLRLQYYELSKQLDLCDQEYASIRATKPAVVPTVPLPNDEDETPASPYCLRTVPLTSISSSHRKLIRPLPDPYVYGPDDDHPLLSIHAKKITGKFKREQMLGNAYKHRNKKTTTANAPTDNLTARLANRRRERAHTDAPSDLVIEDRRTRSVRKETQSQPHSSSPVTRKQSLRTRDFNINNMVIPTYSASSITPTTPLVHKDIETPKWVEIDGEMEISKNNEKSEKNVKSENSGKFQNNKEIAVVREISEENYVENSGSSSSEDTSDETFISLHFKNELQERKRYLSNKYTLPILSDIFPNEFSASSKDLAKCQDNEQFPITNDVVTKLKEKFERIRKRYYNAPVFVRLEDWRKRPLEEEEKASGDTSSEPEEYLEALKSPRKKKRFKGPLFRYQIIKKPPIIDPETNRERNIIYLKRIIETPRMDKAEEEEEEEEEEITVSEEKSQYPLNYFVTTFSTESMVTTGIDRTSSYLEIMSENSQQEAMQIEDVKDQL